MPTKLTAEIINAAIVGLVGQMNRQTPIVQEEVQVKMTPTSFNSHPPPVMIHLFQVNVLNPSEQKFAVWRSPMVLLP